MEPDPNETKNNVRETDIFAGLRTVMNRINQRQLVLRNRSGKDLMQLPMVWVIVILVLALILQVVPIVAIAVIVLLLTKHQFILQNRL
jgi:heme/copper-type cytochrome/quinol oxidase subunit 1